jgi:alkanesulfonate monooxygenase SsuD/methylene tetrahydromethanopterin reductase-like flavin-dependent oxidoreductase (luciferase family)
MNVDVGVVLPTRLGPHALSFDELLALASAADQDQGWSHVWVTDSIISLPFYDSVVLLAACAARTSRVRLGVACQASLGLRQPLVVAQQWANLDVLSKGRMTLIACPGEATGPTREKELKAFNMTHREKVSRMQENIAFLRALSAGGSISFSGDYFSIDDYQLNPAFVQRPLPIWFTGNPPADASAERVARVLGNVARFGDGWLTFALTPKALAQRNEILTSLWAENGKDATSPIPVGVFLNVNVNPDAALARSDALSTWQRQSTRNVSPEVLQEVAAIGSPEQVVDFIGQLVDAGATSIAVELLSEHPAEQFDLIAQHVLPLLAPTSHEPGH